MSLITTDEGHKNYSKDWFLMNSQSTFVVLTFFKLNEMAIVSKERKPNNFESHNSLKLSFTNIRGLRLKFADCKSLLESNSPDILALCEAKLGFWQYLCQVLSFFNQKGFCYSYAWSCSLCEGGLPPFARDLSLENSADSCVFDRLYLTHCLTSFSSIDHLLHLYTRFSMLFHIT